MKVIPLNKKAKLLLPEDWSDLKPKQQKKAFRWLIGVFTGSITPFEFRVKMLLELTGYKRKKKVVVYLKNLFHRCLFSKAHYQSYLDDQRLFEDTIEANLIRLAESINFAFEIDGNKIIPNYYFKDNPFPKLGKSAPHFTRNYTIDTNLTAKQFSDCRDCMSELNQDIDPAFRQHLMCKMAQILYRIDYAEACALSPETLFGITFWFTSIAHYFQHHAIYSILFRPSNTEDEDKISLGLSEVILYLKKGGYSDSQDMNIIDFFDAQIKALKDSLSKALAEGAKMDELAKRTGLSFSLINKLT